MLFNHPSRFVVLGVTTIVGFWAHRVKTATGDDVAVAFTAKVP